MNIVYTLDKSKGSQTAILPKLTYKELQTQRRLVKMTVYLHLHNKYKTFKVLIKIPDEYKDYPLGWIQIKDDYKWANHLPLPEMIGKWEPKETNKVEYNWKTYYLDEDEYYYEINDVYIIKNKKYKAPPVEEKPRLRRQRPIRHVLLREETDLNAKLEELQKQEEKLTNEYQMVKCARETAAQKLKEAKLEIDESNKKSIDLRDKLNEIEEEIKKNKIEIAKKNNKNGYVILAHDDRGGKEQVYGYSQRFEEAQTIAEEAVKMGSRRLEKRAAIEPKFYIGAEIEALWPKDNKWYKATIIKVPGDSGWREPNDDECDEGWSEGGKNKNNFDVKWKDGGQYTYGLELHQLRNITDYNKFDSARIVDLDTQIEVEEYGEYIECIPDYGW